MGCCTYGYHVAVTQKLTTFTKKTMQWNNLFSWLKPRKFDKTTYFYPVKASTFNKIDHAAAYLSIPEIHIVINIKARAFSNARFSGDAQTLKLLQEPNWLQSGKEFLLYTKIMREVYGNEYIFVLRPFGMNTPRALYSLMPLYVKAKIKQDAPYFFTTEPEVEYKYDDNKHKLVLNQADVIHFTSNRFQIGNEIAGNSTLDALTPVINNIINAYEARGVLLRYRGALGILSNETKDGVGNPYVMDEKEKQRIQQEYSNYGLRSDQYQIIITNQSVKWQQMTVDPDKLGIFEEIRESYNKILDAFGVPPDLVTRQQGSTYENQRQAELGFYVRTIIPEMSEWIAGINSALGSNITAEYTHLPIFNDNIKTRNENLIARVNALSRMLADGVIDKNVYLREVEEFLTS
ncbi:MAG: hypothetical protein KatS3mg031_2929 [Chitinophagales bacterium]|nr:MAG: hypothetical protein KatS3mg031_2929 [Chitinophagales bacterium]